MIADRTSVRDAISTDWSVIAELLGQLGYPPLPGTDLAERTALSSERGGVVVAEIEKRVAGFASYDGWFEFAENLWVCRRNAVCVDSASRGRGVGRALLDEVEVRARLSGCSIVELSSGRRSERTPAHALYRTSGYEDRTSDHVTYAKHIGVAGSRT
jgi:GNAT superfamily N-acetyltransferase